MPVPYKMLLRSRGRMYGLPPCFSICDEIHVPNPTIHIVFFFNGPLYIILFLYFFDSSISLFPIISHSSICIATSVSSSHTSFVFLIFLTIHIYNFSVEYFAKSLWFNNVVVVINFHLCHPVSFRLSSQNCNNNEC